MTTIECKLSSEFANDRWGRDLPNGNAEMYRTKRGALYTFTLENFVDLFSDAEYYSDEYGPEVWPALKSSAKRQLQMCRTACGCHTSREFEKLHNVVMTY